MNTNAVTVFTGKSTESIFEEGGSSSWVMDRTHAMGCRYLVCCRSGIDWVEGPEPRGSAFLVGIISDIVPSPDPDLSHRWLVKISEYALVAARDVWRGWRNPVRYTTLEELGIDPTVLDFKPMPETMQLREPRVKAKYAVPAESNSLTIAEAKRGLAKTFSVAEDAIEITIRG